MPILVCAFALIVFPVLTLLTSPDLTTGAPESRPETRLFWPAMALISVLLAAQGRSRSGKLVWPPHLICLFAYLAFAGASVLWAFSLQSSFVRFLQQAMVVTSIVLPAMLAARSVDMMHNVFLCFAFSVVLNLLFVFGGSVTIVQYGSMGAVNIGYQGYFLGKNYLGECAAIALLLAFHELRYRGRRRIWGGIVAVISISLVVLSDSKTALGLAIMCPVLAGVTLFLRRITRLSPALILLSIPLCYVIVSSVSNFNMNRVSFMLYGDSTFTGRTVIWDFVQYEIDQRPFLGWGYQSFWLVPGSPAIFEAPGWVKMMPNGHNGYYDTMLELGYVGLGLLLTFIIATLHAIGRVVDRDPARARLLLSLALFVICYNYFESLWMRGFEFLWVVFIFVVAEIGRYWQPLPLSSAVLRSERPGPGGRPGGPGPLPSARAAWLRAGVP